MVLTGSENLRTLPLLRMKGSNPLLMICISLAISAVIARAFPTGQIPLRSPTVQAVTILHGNDDGFGTAYIRALYLTLKDAGYKTAISAPANNKSGSGSREAPPEPLSSSSDYGFLPAGAPAQGTDPADEHIYYVNSYPVTAIKYGISTVVPTVHGSMPGLVVSGINHGLNLGLATLGSGTVGAANEAVSQDIPAIAFSAPGNQRSHLDLTRDDVAFTYSRVASKLVNAVLASGAPYLPPNVGLNVNFNDGTSCAPDAYVFVLTRINWNPFAADVHHCGKTQLPTEGSVMYAGPCRATISVFAKGSKVDVDKEQQKAIRDKLASILSCV